MGASEEKRNISVEKEASSATVKKKSTGWKWPCLPLAREKKVSHKCPLNGKKNCWRCYRCCLWHMEIITTCLSTPQEIGKTLCRSGFWRLTWPNQTHKSPFCLRARVESVLSQPSTSYVSPFTCNRLTTDLALIMQLNKLHRGRTLHQDN